MKAFRHSWLYPRTNAEKAGLPHVLPPLSSKLYFSMRFWKSVLWWVRVANYKTDPYPSYYQCKLASTKKALNMSILSLSIIQSPIKQGTVWIFLYLWTEVSQRDGKSQILSKFQIEAILEITPFSSAEGGGGNLLSTFPHIPFPLPSKGTSELSYQSGIMQTGTHKHQLSLLYSFWCVNSVSLCSWKKPSSLLLYCRLQGLIGIKTANWAHVHFSAFRCWII